MAQCIRAVIFDWGGVLLNQTWKGQMAYAAKALGVDPERLDAECHDTTYRLFFEGCISEQTFWKKICNALGVRTPWQQSLWYDALHSVAEHQPAVWEMASTLRACGFKIGLLSNLDMVALKWLEENGDLTCFDAKVYSCHEGKQKPDRRIYQKVVAALNVERHEAVMIDDKPRNIEGALNAGLHGIHFQNVPQLRQELSSFGLAV